MAEPQLQAPPRGLDPVALGLAIRDRRKAAHMTQEVTAALCGISKKTLIKIEKGGDVYLSTLLQVMNALGMSLQLVADNKVSMGSPATPIRYANGVKEEAITSGRPDAGGDDEWF